MNDTLQLDAAGIALIKCNETRDGKPILNAYWDVTGYAIGFGHHGPEVNANSVWTETQCEDALTDDTLNVQSSVRKLVLVILTQGQFNALVSFSYNIGIGNFASSHVLFRVNNGQYNQVPYELRRWVYSNHQIDPGLVQRREKEIEAWNAPS